MRTALNLITARVEQSPTGGLMVLAALVGAVAGLGAVGFAALIDALGWFFFDVVKDDWLSGLGRWGLILIPALGMLPVGWITLKFAREARGHGVPEVMLAVETGGGRIRARVATAKSVASALTIGAGGSAGKEGPIVQIGSAFGSTVAQVLSLSEQHTKLLLACGAAGGIAATFNAPIAGMFFAVEVLLRRFTTRNFSMVLLASVVATMVATAFHGGEAVIAIPEYRLQSPFIEIPLYALLGGISGASGIAFTRVLYWAEDRFNELPFPPLVLMPVVGGLSVGVLALFDQDVLGLSEDAMDAALNGNSAIRTMALLFILKLLATALTIGSGGSGGVFRPSLTMGSMIGGVFGGAANRLLPGLTAASGAYATVGMAAMFAGAARAPVTSVLIIFEMTRDYSIVLPVMTAVAIATLVSHMLSEGTIYTIKLARRGIEIQDEQPALGVMQTLRVADAMSAATVTTSRESPVAEVVEMLGDQSEILALVLDDDGDLHGVITHVDLNNAIAEGNYEKTASDVCTTDVATAFLDETLLQALTRMSDYDVHALPVVRRGVPKRPIGILRRSDVTRTYLEEMKLRESAATQLAVLDSDVRSIDLRIKAGSQLDGKLLSESRLPDGAILVTVRHDGVTQIPHGTTRLEAGDEVTVVLTEFAMDEVRTMFGSSNPRTPIE